MLTIPRFIRPIAIGLGFGLAMVLMVAFVSRDSGDAAASNEPVRIQPTSVKRDFAPPDIDALVAQILERPLFSPSRSPADEASEQVAEAPKEPLKLPGRLEGVSIRPDAREALFERDGEKPIAVKEGQEIGGWTIDSIQPGQVVLKSADGEQIVKPANGVSIKAPQLQAMNRKSGPGANKPVGAVSAAVAAKPVLQRQPLAPAGQRPTQAAARTGR